MKQRFRSASLVPSGLMVDGIAIEDDHVVVRARAALSACPCPDCGAIPMHPILRRVIDETRGENLTFLVTAYDRPFTAAGFGNWFRDRCDDAGLPQCASHGLRKAAARRLAEAGCSNQQSKAITGHKTDSEVARYTAAADQVRLAGQAMKAACGMEREQKPSNRIERIDSFGSKSLKDKN